MSGVTKDPNQLAQAISSNIQRITQQTSEIQRLVSQLATSQDTAELRHQLDQKKQNVNRLAKDTDKLLKEFGSLPVLDNQRQRKIQKDRLVRDFSSALAVFQQAQRNAAEKEREVVARVRASSRVSGGFNDDPFGGSTSPFESDIESQAQIQEGAITEEDLHLIQERETAIRQLESDITDINEIFKDLGMMIHEQGDMIDSIEANVESAGINVQSATQQLGRASDYQQRSRKKILILVTVLVVVAVIIGLIIWASVSS